MPGIRSGSHRTPSRRHSCGRAPPSSRGARTRTAPASDPSRQPRRSAPPALPVESRAARAADTDARPVPESRHSRRAPTRWNHSRCASSRRHRSDRAGRAQRGSERRPDSARCQPQERWCPPRSFRLRGERGMTRSRAPGSRLGCQLRVPRAHAPRSLQAPDRAPGGCAVRLRTGRTSPRRVECAGSSAECRPRRRSARRATRRRPTLRRSRRP